MSLKATVLGLIYDSPIVDFPARTGPGTTFNYTPFTVAKGRDDLDILDIEPDASDTQSDFGRVYQWFHFRLPDGREGWLRDHVVGIQGDWSGFGYGKVPDVKHAYLLIRDMSKATSVPPAIDPIQEDTQPVSTVTITESETTDTDAAAETTDAASSDEATPPATPAPTLQKTRTTAIAKPQGPPRAIIKVQSQAYTRQGPSTIGYDRVYTVPRNAEVNILEVRRENQGRHLRWYRIEYNSQQAWIREDLVQYTGDTEAVGLPWDLYPAPMAERWWIRDYNRAPYRNDNEFEHWGWDFGAHIGEPIYCGPFGATVMEAFQCPKCMDPSRPSTVLNGIDIGSTAVLSDPQWGYGYGHYVILRYANDQLPESTKDAITQMGYPGGSIFVMYAHLQRFSVQPGQELGPGQIFAYCGNSGNSEAQHLHLELRVSKKADYSGWANIKDGLTSPIILFNR